MSIETIFTTIPKEQVVSQALRNMRRAVMFEVVLHNIRAEIKKDDSTLQRIKTTLELQSLVSHSIFHSMMEVKDYGGEKENAEANGMVKALELYRNEGFLSPLIFPREGVALELVKFRNDFINIDYRKATLNSEDKK